MFWWNEAVEVIEAIEVVEAVEVIEAAEVRRPEKSQLGTSESSRFLNSALFWCLKKYFWGLNHEISNFPLFMSIGCNFGAAFILLLPLLSTCGSSRIFSKLISHPNLFRNSTNFIQELLYRWTSQLDLGITAGGLERAVSVHNST